jgi:hypothetical protein
MKMENYTSFFRGQHPRVHVVDCKIAPTENPNNPDMEAPITPLRLAHLKDAPKPTVSQLAAAGIHHVHELLSFCEDAHALVVLAKAIQVQWEEFCLLIQLASRAYRHQKMLTSRLDGVNLVFVEDGEKEQAPAGPPQTAPPSAEDSALVAAVLRCLSIDASEVGHPGDMPMANASTCQHHASRSTMRRILVRPHEVGIHVLEIR